MTVEVEAEAFDTSLTQRGSQRPVPSTVLMPDRARGEHGIRRSSVARRFEWRVSARAVEEDEAAYGLNATRARPVSMVQVRHGCLGCCHARERRHLCVRVFSRAWC